MIQDICLLLLKVTAIYFLSINVAYGVLMVLSWIKIKRFRRKVRKETVSSLSPVTFLVPAFNEESLIVETIQTYLSLSNVQKEIIVIDDGSHDRTFKLLQNMFQLQKVDSQSKLFRSISYPELKVLEAPHMGKAQALNLGIEHANFDLICTMDADTVPVSQGVEKILRAFASDSKLIAAGGVIQVLNSKVLKDNSPLPEGPSGMTTSFQSIEYLRTFICERLGWSFLGSTILISGAFCMVKKEALKKVGGFRQDSITEDLDLIVRLRKEYQAEKYHFRILPFTTCYTQVPQTLKHLKVQRMRWQLGLIDTLKRNLSLVFHPGYGPLGLFAVPYYWLVEVLSPILEVTALIVVPWAMWEGWISVNLVLFYLGVGLGFNVLITLLGIYLDNKYISRNKNWSCWKGTLHSLFIHFGYKQLNSWWRLLALMKSFKKSTYWGEKPREEIIHRA